MIFIITRNRNKNGTESFIVGRTDTRDEAAVAEEGVYVFYYVFIFAVLSPLSASLCISKRMRKKRK